MKDLRKKKHPCSKSGEPFNKYGLDDAWLFFCSVDEFEIGVVLKSYLEGPHLREAWADEANQDLEDKDKNDLFVGLDLEFWEFCPRFAWVFHDFCFMSCIDYHPNDPFCVLHWSSSKKERSMIQRKQVLASCELKSSFEFVKLVIWSFTVDVAPYSNCSFFIFYYGLDFFYGAFMLEISFTIKVLSLYIC